MIPILSGVNLNIRGINLSQNRREISDSNLTNFGLMANYKSILAMYLPLCLCMSDIAKENGIRRQSH